MFRKRMKKEFPPGTFIPLPARVAAIIQLCLAFSFLLWLISQPFMGDLFRVKSQMLVYQDVMGINPYSNEKTERLERNALLFSHLPLAQKENLLEKYAALQKELNQTFFQKMQKLIRIFTIERSPFELAWILLSIFIPVLLLKRVEGAANAAWLLPALALLFLFDNQFHGIKEIEPEKDIFPSEQVIIRNYLEEPLSHDVLIQKTQLTRGWNLYLIRNWTQATASKNPFIFQQQAEEGEFWFNVKRLSFFNLSVSNSPVKKSLYVLCLYFVWNLFFAWLVNRSLSRSAFLTFEN